MSVLRSRVIGCQPVIDAFDTDSTIAFYTEKLGFSCLLYHPGHAVLERDGFRIVVEYPDETKEIRRSGICFIIRVENLQIEFDALSKLNVPIKTRPHEFVFGIHSTKTFTIEDPDGNEIQILEEGFTTSPQYTPYIMQTNQRPGW